MRAAIYQGQGRVTLTELPTPQIGDDDVLIQNLHAGICGSDVSAYLHGPRAHRITPGSEFGHEVVSRVAATGKNVTAFRVGQRVYPYPLLARGDRSRAGTLGGFSQYIRVPSPQPGVQLYPVPEAISDKKAALIEPFTIAMHAARRADPVAGESAIVFGAGTIGIAVAISLSHLGIDKILLTDLSDFRLGKAADLGFLTCNPMTDDLRSRAVEIFGSTFSPAGSTADVDIFVDAAGEDSLVSTFQDLGKLQARLVTVAVHANPVPVDFARLAYSQHRISGSGGYAPQDVATVMDLMSDERWDIESIVTHEFPLDQIVTALQTAANRDISLNVSIVH